MNNSQKVDKLAVRVAQNDANQIGTLNLLVARLQEQLADKDAIIAELQQQIKGLRGEKVARSTNTANKQGKHQR